MLKHICNDPTLCKRCRRNARLRARYSTDSEYRAKRVAQSNARFVLSQETIERNRIRARERYHRLKNTPEFQEKERIQRRKRRPLMYRFPALPTASYVRGYWRMVILLLTQRDGWECWICHAMTTWKTVSIDHVIPRCIEPENDDPGNLRVAHRLCNSARGSNYRWQ